MKSKKKKKKKKEKTFSRKKIKISPLEMMVELTNLMV